MPIIFRWYKHSFLASLVSLLGTATLAIGIGLAVSGGILYGIGVALAGALFLWLGSKIADRKAKKIAAKNAANFQPSAPAPAVQKTPSPSSPSPGNSGAKPVVTRGTAANPVRSTPPAANPDPKKLSLNVMLQRAAKFGSAGVVNKQISTLKQASEDYPDNSGVFNLLGIAYKNAGRYQESFDCYRKAANLAPENGVIHGNYAISLMASGDDKSALNRFERALPLLKKENNPDYAFYLANYAYALGKCGYAENALRCLGDAEKAGYANAGKIRAKLEKLGIHS